jgi:hypothetical protein
VLSALGAITGVTPRAKKSRAILVQQDGKVIALRIDLEAEIGAPLSGDVARARLESFQNSSEPHPVGVEKEGAVARLEDKRFHGSNSAGRTLQQAKSGIANL